MECFEITFFCKKELYNEKFYSIMKESLEIFRSMDAKHFYDLDKDSPIPFNERFRVFVHDDEDEELDYTVCSASVAGITTRECTFEDIVKNYVLYIGEIFKKIEVFRFAVGIYGMIWNVIEDEENYKLDSFDSDFLSKFPLVFLRRETNSREYEGSVIFEDDNIACVFNDKVQQLFSDY